MEFYSCSSDELTHSIMEFYSCSPDELMHYGVKGMKWGVRKDRDSSTNRGKKYKYDSDGHRKLTTNEVKEYVKPLAVFAPYASILAVSAALEAGGHPIGAAFARGAMMLGHAGLMVYSVVSNVNDYYKRADRRLAEFEKVDGKKEKLSELKKIKGKKESVNDSINVVNPEKANLGSGCEVNCVSCAMAIDLRQKGYDVRARRQNQGLTDSQIASYYKGASIRHIPLTDSELPPQIRYNKVVDFIKSDGGGNSSGILTMSWGKDAGGHAIYYKSVNGNVEFYDGQNGKYGPALDKYFVHGVNFTSIRTDNKKPSEKVGDCVVSKRD